MSAHTKCLFKINKKDGSSWKRVLLTWINHCGFLGRNYYNIEQTNIYEFFEKFQGQISNLEICPVDLLVFLREHYPAVELHTDDNQQLSSSDYMYVYSIFLHFSCVKHPTEFFQNICQNFHEANQQAIAIFFKGLLEKDVIDKELLRKMIAEASLQSSLCSISIESPAKSQQHYKISPPTPKTHMLEEKNKELHVLKASLETEKYEKGYLEIQNKQYEEKIKKLENERKFYLSEVLELRGRLNTEDNLNEGSSSKCSFNIQERNRFQKLVNEKEELIFDLKQNLDSLAEEKDLMKKKLKYAQKDVSVYLSKISEMEFERTKFTEELERRDETLKMLNDTKKELEDIVAELQSQNKCFMDQNSSLDYLDLSSSHNSNLSNSLCCAENLGRTVVDIQLREKENENILLLNQIEKLRNNNSSLSKHISELLKKHHEVFDICPENLISDENAESISHNFMIFENYFSKLIENYQQTTQNVKQLYEDKSSLELQMKNLNGRVIDLEKLITDSSRLVTSHNLISQSDMDCDNTNLKTKLENYIDMVNKKLSDRNRVIQFLNERNRELPKLYLKIFEAESEYFKNVDTINESLRAKCLEINDILKDNLELAEQSGFFGINMAYHQENIKNLLAIYLNLQSERKSLFKENNNLKESFDKQERKLEKVNQNFENLRFENEKIVSECLMLRNEIDNLNKNLEDNLKDSNSRQIELKELNEQYLKMTQSKEALELEIKILNEEFSTANHNFSKALSEKSKEIEKLLDSLNEKKFEIKCLEKQNNNHLENINSLETIASDLQKKIENLDLKYIETSQIKKTLEESNKNLIENVNKLNKHLKEAVDENTLFATKNQQLTKECQESENNTIMLKNKIQELENEVSTKQVELKTKEDLLANFEVIKTELLNENQIIKEKLVSIEENERDLISKNLELIQSSEQNMIHISSTKTAMENFKVQFKNQASKIQHYFVKNEELNSLLKQKINDISSFQSRYNELKIEYEQRDLQVKNLINELSEKQSQLNNIETEKENLKKILLKVEKENFEFSNTIESLTIYKLNAEDEIEEVKSKLDAKNFEIKELNTKFDNDLNEIVQQIENNIESFLEPEIIVKFLESGLNSDCSINRLRKSINTLLNNNKSLLCKKEMLDQDMQTLSLDFKNSIENNNKMQARLLEYEKLQTILQNKLKETNHLISLKDSEYSKTVSTIINKLKQDRLLLKNEYVFKNDLVRKIRENEQIKNKLINQISATEGKLQGLNEEKDNCLQEICDLKQSIFKLQTKLSEINKEYDMVILEKSDMVKKCVNYEKEKILISTELRAKNAEIGQMKKKLDALHDEVDQLEINKKNLLHYIENITNEKELLSKELSQKNTENIQFKQENCDLQNKLELLNEQKKHVFDQNLTLNEEIKNLSLELKSNINKNGKELEEIKNECFKITTENWELKCERDDLVHKLKSKAFEVDEIRELLKTKTEKLQDEIKCLLEIKYEQITEFEKKKKENSELQIQIEELNQQVSAKDSKLSLEILNLEEKLKIADAENVKLKNDRKMEKEKLEILINENKKNIHEITEKYQSELNSFKLDCEKYVQKVKENKAELEKLEKESNILKNENLLMKEEINSKEKLIDAYRKEIEESTEKFIKLENAYKLLDEENNTLNTEIMSLNKIKSNVPNLTEQIKEIQAKYDNVVSELQVTLIEKQTLIENQEKNEENLEKTNKNLELKSFRLGEEQAKSAKLLKDIEHLKKSNSDTKLHLENLQKDYLKLQSDCKSLQIKLLDQEKNIDSYKNQNELLVKEKENLTANLVKKSESEASLQKLLSNLQVTENENSISINNLTTILAETKKFNDDIKTENVSLKDRNSELIDQINNLNKVIEDSNKNVNEINETITNLQNKLEIVYEENNNLNDKLSKVSIQLDISNTTLEETKLELCKCKNQIIYFENENKNMENIITDYISKIEDLQKEKDNFVAAHAKEETILKDKLKQIEDSYEQKKNEIKKYEKQIELFKSNKFEDLDKINKKYQLLEHAFENERSETKRLRTDLEIFHAKLLKSRKLNDENEKKWLEEKKHLENQSDEKIKENRVELEGKLEKMKNRMKSLYNEEVAKLKKKNGAEIFDYQAENQALKGKCEKFDQHIKTLSKNVITLTERVCELERDNKFMECKLKNYETNNRNSLRPHRPQSSTWTAPPLKNVFDGNFRIEDEEGEILNNTYLADIDFGTRDSVSTQELQFRNSLAPPHLRSAYLAQYGDTQLTEEDVKDGLPPIAFDDSLTSLMSGHRKKLAGTTSYKKPGPPTPSKSGGRLSFGGNSEVHASILKEYNENEQKKTPAKFKLFSSRSNTKDENTPPKRRSISNIFRKK